MLSPLSDDPVAIGQTPQMTKAQPLLSAKQAQRLLAAESSISKQNESNPQLTTKSKTKPVQTSIESKEDTSIDESWVKTAGKEASKAVDSTNDPKATGKAKVLSEEECERAFMDLLKEKNVRGDMEWAQVLPIIIYDGRYSAIQTLKKRKNIFQKYLDELEINEEKEYKKRKQAKIDSFLQMLAECDKITAESRFNDIKELLQDDERFTALERRNREDYALDYVDGLRKKGRRLIVKRFESIIREDESITYHSRFKDVLFRIADGKKPYDIKEFKNERMERDFRKVFESYLDELIKIHDDKRKKEQEDQRRRREIEKKEREQREKDRKKREKKQQEDLIVLFDMLAKEKTLIHAKTQWSEARMLTDLTDDQRYQCFSSSRDGLKYVEDKFEDYC